MGLGFNPKPRRPGAASRMIQYCHQYSSVHRMENRALTQTAREGKLGCWSAIVLGNKPDVWSKQRGTPGLTQAARRSHYAAACGCRFTANTCTSMCNVSWVTAQSCQARQAAKLDRQPRRPDQSPCNAYMQACRPHSLQHDAVQQLYARYEGVRFTARCPFCVPSHCPVPINQCSGQHLKQWQHSRQHLCTGRQHHWLLALHLTQWLALSHTRTSSLKARALELCLPAGTALIFLINLAACRHAILWQARQAIHQHALLSQQLFRSHHTCPLHSGMHVMASPLSGSLQQPQLLQPTALPPEFRLPRDVSLRSTFRHCPDTGNWCVPHARCTPQQLPAHRLCDASSG
ncbi:hypothetical protein COO60DRAFT_547617 [Scenedesmus sp. NREL 46B-D3]|nr:hypothetical protein COO60DRAFT_547617 [Scenedesmus sp. NREL 46B-D3]